MDVQGIRNEELNNRLEIFTNKHEAGRTVRGLWIDVVIG